MRNKQIAQAVMAVTVIAAITMLVALKMILTSSDSVDLKMKLMHTEFDINKKEVKEDSVKGKVSDPFAGSEGFRLNQSR